MSKSSKGFVNKSRYTDKYEQKKDGRHMKRSHLFIFGLILCLVISAAGCAQQPQAGTPVPSLTPQASDYLSIDPEPLPVKENITLYYKSKYAGYLSPVTRSIYKRETPIEKLVVQELLKGPQGPDAQRVVSLIPAGTQMQDVTMKGSTVFVYFDSGITGDLSLQALWGDAYINQDQALLEQKSRELLFYSIVNTMTELPGIANVKILVDNKIATYADLGLESWAQGSGAASADASMPSYSRSASYILQPTNVVNILMNEWNAEQPNWDKIYPFLYPWMTDGTPLPGQSEMERQWSATILKVTLTADSIKPQEFRTDGTALVSVTYSIERSNGDIQPVDMEYMHFISQGGIWKLSLSPHWLEEDYAY